MKVYFTGSFEFNKVDRAVYEVIIKALEKMGHKVQSDHILKDSIKGFDRQTITQRSEYYKRMNKVLSGADVVVAEVSFPSTLNIGHEVSLALDKGKPIVALYQKGREPGVLKGISSDRFVLLEYEDKQDVVEVLEYGMDEALEKMDVRFNFFISPEIGRYLDWVAKKKRVPRAVYLRRLIEEDLEENRDYKE